MATPAKKREQGLYAAAIRAEKAFQSLADRGALEGREPHAYDRLMLALRAYERKDRLCQCRRCGWEFTVHGVSNTPEYEGAVEWFCPHCGEEVMS